MNSKLSGAIARRLSEFLPDAICWITSIEVMLDDFDDSRPNGHTLDNAVAPDFVSMPPSLPSRVGRLALPAIGIQARQWCQFEYR